ncbi:hypothetical protein Tco_1525891 [Tanacetum coccineum]
MSCSLPHTVKEIKEYVQKQCDIDDVALQEAIIVVSELLVLGIDIPSILCHICSIAGKSSSHILFTCQVARHLMLKVTQWWELEIQDSHCYADWLIWFINLCLSKGLKDVLEGVFYVMW